MQETSEELCYAVEKLVNIGWSFITSPETETVRLSLSQDWNSNPFSEAFYFSGQSTNNSSAPLLTLKLGNGISSPTEQQQLASPVQQIPLPLQDVEPEIVAKIDVHQSIKELKIDGKTNSAKQYPDPLQAFILPQLPTRIQSSRLQRANFEIFSDANGNQPLDRTGELGAPQIDYRIEIEDTKSDNFIVQLMGVTLNDEFSTMHNGIIPNSLSFGLKFYKFQQVATERVKLYVDNELPPSSQQSSEFSKQRLRNDAVNWPGILYHIGSDHRPDCIYV